MSFYRHHVFFCTNLRTNGKASCQEHEAQDLCKFAKQKLKSLGKSGVGGVRVSQSGCLGRCELGPILVIYPEQVWYTYESQQDIDEIISEHLLNGRIIERLLVDR